LERHLQVPQLSATVQPATDQQRQPSFDVRQNEEEATQRIQSRSGIHDRNQTTPGERKESKPSMDSRDREVTKEVEELLSRLRMATATAASSRNGTSSQAQPAQAVGGINQHERPPQAETAVSERNGRAETAFPRNGGLFPREGQRSEQQAIAGLGVVTKTEANGARPLPNVRSSWADNEENGTTRKVHPGEKPGHFLRDDSDISDIDFGYEDDPDIAQLTL